MADLQFVNTPEWSQVVKRYLRSEMSLHDMTYRNLAQELKREFDINQSENNLKTKINQGILGTQLFLQILCVLGTASIDIGHLQNLHDKIKD